MFTENLQSTEPTAITDASRSATARAAPPVGLRPPCDAARAVRLILIDAQSHPVCRRAFLTGETGSGKSTVLKLLLKALHPSEGRILADGIDLTRIESSQWFAHVGVVPQDVTLLADTLSANIVLGRPFDAQRLHEAAAQASILHRIEAMPDGFDTVVGERGLKLSGGERQRIAIARALYAGPALLVLDEASSALDDDTERQIMDGLRKASGELTIIAVTHRTSMIREGDQVVRLGEN